MKKIFLTLTAVLGLAACIKDDIVPVVPADTENVVLDFSVVIPEAQTATKAFSDNPAISGITVLVFDENKMLLETAVAEIKDNAETAEVEFEVTLPQHPSPCSVHFVANCPAGIPAEGSEAEIMTSLQTTDKNDAYWQCVAVDNLITANDALAEVLAEKFKAIPLIRNFAKVSVVVDNTKVSSSDFTLDAYELIYVPNSGTVVPYNTNTGVFEPYNTNGVGHNYSFLKGRKYDGFMPIYVDYNENIPNEVTNKMPLYTYESKLRSKNNTALIVKGTYKGKTGYYKVDFMSPDNEYNNGNYEILRNLHYIVNINNVQGPGYDSPAAAAAAAAGNNISASFDIQDLLNISDGTSRLFVDQTVKHVVTESAFTIKFRYEPTLGGTPDNDDAVITTDENGSVIATYSVAASDESGWRTIEITPNSLPSESAVYQDITISKGVLSRTVRIWLHMPYIMNVTCTPTATSAIKASVVVSVTIPGNLTEEIFPLVFDMEDTQLCLSPDATYTAQGAVPVTTEPSIITPSKETFHYKRTLTWDQYSALPVVNGGRTFETHFLTNKTSVSGITVYVKHELFGEAQHN